MVIGALADDWLRADFPGGSSMFPARAPETPREGAWGPLLHKILMDLNPSGFNSAFAPIRGFLLNPPSPGKVLALGWRLASLRPKPVFP